MKISELNITDACSYETFGGDYLKSGAYLIDIKSVSKWEKEDKCFLSLEFEVNDQIRYAKMWLTKTKDNSTTVDIFNTKRLSQMMFLMQIRPENVQEVASDKPFWYNLPQLKGSVGAVLEVKPANACKPSQDGNQYPEISILGFYDLDTMKTLKERTENLPAKEIKKQVDKLELKTYKPYLNETKNQTSQAPQQFNVESDLREDELPF